jgi:hypothetical protein
LIFLAACSKNDISTRAEHRLGFSADTIRFDTVFTTLRSSTKRLMVYNPNSQSVRTHISFSGKSSPFRINVDGRPVDETCEVEIAGRDSMYIFVEVTVNPQNRDLPVLVRDSLIFETNANQQRVRLEAYGQDVFILRNDTIQSSTWQGAKPYLIYGQLVVDTLHSLRITQGVTVYLSKGADICVKGTLIAEGSVEHPVVFSGSRLDAAYHELPGQWGSILFATASKDNVLRHVQIRNGTNGLLVGNLSGNDVPHITLDAVVISNMSYSGLMTFAADLEASNCRISNCVYYTVGLFLGGTSRFTHCTLANNYASNIRRRSIPVLTVHRSYSGHEQAIPPRVTFRNSIIYGNLSEELAFDDADCSFHYCLLRTLMKPVAPQFNHVYTNINPLFVAPESDNFRIAETSPARDTGSMAFAEEVPKDMAGNSRIADEKPDLGAFEWK